MEFIVYLLQSLHCQPVCFLSAKSIALKTRSNLKGFWTLKHSRMCAHTHICTSWHANTHALTCHYILLWHTQSPSLGDFHLNKCSTTMLFSWAYNWKATWISLFILNPIKRTSHLFFLMYFSLPAVFVLQSIFQLSARVITTLKSDLFTLMDKISNTLLVYSE